MPRTRSLKKKSQKGFLSTNQGGQVIPLALIKKMFFWFRHQGTMTHDSWSMRNLINESHHAETCLFSAMHNCMWQNNMFSHIADINAQMGPMGPMEDG